MEFRMEFRMDFRIGAALMRASGLYKGTKTVAGIRGLFH